MLRVILVTMLVLAIFVPAARPATSTRPPCKHGRVICWLGHRGQPSGCFCVHHA